jgi:hypothetical protein
MNSRIFSVESFDNIKLIGDKKKDAEEGKKEGEDMGEQDKEHLTDPNHINNTEENKD